jgi:YidC/Oxa1 family membrane protein insertase
MDNLRFVLFLLLGLLSYMAWEQWQIDYVIRPAVQGNPALDPAAVTAPPPAGGGSVQPENAAGAPATGSKRIRVATDVLRLEIDTQGGDIRVMDLLAYPETKGEPDKKVRLLSDDPANWHIVQSGLLTSGGETPNHLAVWEAENDRFALAEGQDTLRVPLTWRDAKGVNVTKTFIFKRGSYLIGVEHAVRNNSDAAWRARPYTQLQRVRPANTGSQLVRSYTGGVYYNAEDKYKKLDFDDMESSNLNRTAAGGWFAMIQHYFVAAWIPPAEGTNTFYSKKLPGMRYLLGASSDDVEVPAGGQTTISAGLFAGPKLQQPMELAATGLELTEDYGILTVIAKPIFWLMQKSYGLFHNWGIAIITVTLVIKLMFYKLSEASYRSMARMRKLQPRLQSLKEQFGSDKQRFNQAMMDLYRKEKVNPLGGCLPILIQIPVFISLYWVLAESVQLRQAPFFLWLDDLSALDPYFLLPLLMGVTMWIQQKLNPSSMDPMQEKILKMFPFIFTVFFAFFPSGLVLYWVVNNSLSIVQQWHITRVIERTT